MAEKRMFAKSIVLSDAFLDMPMSARCLYFTLGMLADDDGFVNAPKSIIRQCGASNDDLKVLLAKRYLLAFESGVIVIKHWRINNYLRGDRYVATTYVEEKSTLTLDEKNAYVEAGKPLGIPGGIPGGIPSTVYPEEKSIEEISIDKKSRGFTPPTLEEIESYIKEKDYDVDPQRFYDYFSEGGWKDSAGKPVRNWKQKIITWNGRDRARGKSIKFDYEQRVYKDSDFEHLYLDLDKDPTEDT